MKHKQLVAERHAHVPSQRSTSTVTSCRACGSGALHEFLSLGSTPIANALVEPKNAGTPDTAYPLVVGFCAVCSLVQLTNEPPAEAIFGANYPYFSSYSETLVEHSAEHVDALVRERSLDGGSFVVEIASNDGYLLRRFLEHRVPILGIDPSPGPADAARQVGIPTMEMFFDVALATDLRAERGAADVVLANNVMAHVPDLNGFVEGLSILVADDGIVQVENPCVRYLMEQVAFDTVYHEHLCYFSTIAVEALFAQHGLVLLDVDHFPDLHGGTLRWTAGKRGTASPAALRHLAEERALGLDTPEFYQDFGSRVSRNQVELVALLSRLRAQGSTIAAYGAAAKGATLLNSTGIGSHLIDFVVDLNVHKQGKLMPGVRIPVLDPSALNERRPDYVLLLAWNFKSEIMRQQDEYRRGGGRFISPVPRPEIL